MIWQLSKQKHLYSTLLLASHSLETSKEEEEKKKALLPLKIMENNNDNEFTCCHCHRIFFNSLNDFRDHNTVAHAGYDVECNLCQNVFSNSTELQTHRQQRHQPQPPPPATAPQQQQQQQQQEAAHPQAHNQQYHPPQPQPPQQQQAGQPQG
ncbi:uncharacterized protein LOC142618742 isoform X1 [Castanea sativa]|uniref:uncharacterized protein LOC142618742 isoform X1 n=1 Tax=Castanea sativa TaxID=21020 RepID=UPI003F64A818